VTDYHKEQYCVLEGRKARVIEEDVMKALR
jgi:hypothetical protein